MCGDRGIVIHNPSVSPSASHLPFIKKGRLHLVAVASHNCAATPALGRLLHCWLRLLYGRGLRIGTSLCFYLPAQLLQRVC